MAYSLAEELTNLGMAYPLAKELGSQIDTGQYNWKRLNWLGMDGLLAKYLTASLSEGSFDPSKAKGLPYPISEAIARYEGVGVPEYLGQVASRCYPPANFFDGHKQSMARNGHVAKVRSLNPRIVLPNYWVDGSYAESATGGEATFTAAIEYPAGQFTRVTFGGSNSGVAAAGSTLVSDPIPVDIAPGEMFWSRIFRNSAAGVIFDGASQKKNAGFGDGFVSAATTADLTMGGAVPNTNSNFFAPVAIIAQTTARSVIAFGDSIVHGQGDVADATGSVGLLRRLQDERPFINVARSGESLSNILASNSQRLSLVQYATDVVLEHGRNDLAAKTAAQLIADNASFVANLKAAKPSLRIWRTTLIPVTDAANVTPSANITPKNNTFNAAVRGGMSDVAGVLEYSDIMSSARDSGLWGQTAWQSDGTHPTASGYQQAKTLITPI